MDKILTTFAASGQPFTSPTSLDHLQNAYALMFTEIAKGLIGTTYDSSKAYVMNGFTIGSIPGATTISAGYLLYNDELLYHQGSTVPDFTTPNVIILNLFIGYAGTDPLIYEDGSSHDTHQFRRVSITSGPSGSGTIANLTALQRVLQPPIASVSGAGNIGSLAVDFSRNRVYNFAGVGSSATLTLSMTNATNGSTVEIYTATALAGQVITIAGGGLPQYVTGIDSLTMVNNTTAAVRLKYVQVAGLDYIYIEAFNPTS